MRRLRWTFLLLVVACVLLLPVIYHVVSRDKAGAPLALSLGLLAMGLAWSGGCALENRRRGTVRGIAALGVALPLLALLPAFPEPFAAAERAFLAGAAGASALAVALLLRTPPAR